MRTLYLLPLAALAACGAPAKDYQSAEACDSRGIKANMPGYEDCLRKERSARMLEEQRKEFEQRKADEEFWRNRRL